MEKTFSKAEDLADHIREYVNNRIASVKLSIAEKAAAVLSSIIALIMILLVLGLFIVFAGIAVAYAFAKLTGEYYWGFLIMSGIYLLTGMLLWMAKDWLLKIPIMNAILQQLFKEEENDEKGQ